MATLANFDSHAYGQTIAMILARDGNGGRLMPLASGTCSSPEARKLIKTMQTAKVAPKTVLAGLYLYFSCLDESHTLSQSIETIDGSYWHGIMHRQEPDPGNAAYWFRRVGKHPIFPALRDAAKSLGYTWDPFTFIEDCQDPTNELLLKEVQLAEWQLLFHHCATAR